MRSHHRSACSSRPDRASAAWCRRRARRSASPAPRRAATSSPSNPRYAQLRARRLQPRGLHRRRRFARATRERVPVDLEVGAQAEPRRARWHSLRSMSIVLFLPAGKPRSGFTTRQRPSASCASSARPLGVDVTALADRDVDAAVGRIDPAARHQRQSSALSADVAPTRTRRSAPARCPDTRRARTSPGSGRRVASRDP